MKARIYLAAALLAITAGCAANVQAPAAVTLPTPAPPHSAQPRLTADPSGRPILSWTRQAPGSEMALLEYSRFFDGAWSPPQVVSQGKNWFVNWADFPSILPLTQSHWAAHWLVRRGTGTYAYDVVVAQSFDGGLSWSAPAKPHRDETDTEHGFVSLFPDAGGVGAAWLDGRQSINPEQGMTLRSAILGRKGQLSNQRLVDNLVCDCCQTSVAISNTGPILAFRNRTQDEVRDIYVSRRIGDQWETGKPVRNDGWVISGCPVNGPAIDAQSEIVALAWFTLANDQPRVQLAWSSDGAQSFSAPLILDSSTPLGRVDLALLADNSAVVSWLQQVDNVSAKLMLARAWPDNRQNEARAIAVVPASRASGVPQIVAVKDQIWAGWTALEDRYSQVRIVSVRIDSL